MRKISNKKNAKNHFNRVSNTQIQEASGGLKKGWGGRKLYLCLFFSASIFSHHTNLSNSPVSGKCPIFHFGDLLVGGVMIGECWSYLSADIISICCKPLVCYSADARYHLHIALLHNCWRLCCKNCTFCPSSLLCKNWRKKLRNCPNWSKKGVIESKAWLVFGSFVWSLWAALCAVLCAALHYVRHCMQHCVRQFVMVWCGLSPEVWRTRRLWSRLVGWLFGQLVSGSVGRSVSESLS